MPFYTYRCNTCKKRFEMFMSYAEYDQKVIICPMCGGGHVHRLIDKIRIAKSDDSRMEDLVDPTKLDGLEEDPKALGRLMRRMGNELGEEMGPEFDEVVSRLEKGQDPDQIEKEMPSLGEGLNDAPDLDM